MIDSWHSKTNKPRADELSLCPACGSHRLLIATTTQIEYEVVRDTLDEELHVTSECMGVSQWTMESRARCAQCDWQGTVVEAQSLHAAAPVNIDSGFSG